MASSVARRGEIWKSRCGRGSRSSPGLRSRSRGQSQARGSRVRRPQAVRDSGDPFSPSTAIVTRWRGASDTPSISVPAWMRVGARADGVQGKRDERRGQERFRGAHGPGSWPLSRGAATIEFGKRFSLRPALDNSHPAGVGSASGVREPTSITRHHFPGPRGPLAGGRAGGGAREHRTQPGGNHEDRPRRERAVPLHEDRGARGRGRGAHGHLCRPRARGFRRSFLGTRRSASCPTPRPPARSASSA